MQTLYKTFLPFFTLLISSLNLYAENENNIWLKEDKFKISLATFITDYESDFRLTSSKLGLGTNLSFEEDLGLEDSNTVFRIDGHYRFTANSRIEFSYFDLSRDGKTTTRLPMIIDDTIFRRGSELNTTFDYQVVKLAYAYSIWQTEKVDLSISGGLYTFDVELKVESKDGKSEGDDGTAPFPMFGLHLDYRINNQWYLATSYEHFSIDESDTEGKLTDGMISIEYRPFEHIGFGAGYNIVTVYAEDTESDDEFDFEYDGFMAFVSYRF